MVLGAVPPELGERLGGLPLAGVLANPLEASEHVCYPIVVAQF
jgi:hypothetical protein